MTLREMLEERSTIVTEMRTLTASPSGDGGDLSTEQSKRFDELKTKLEGTERRISRQQTIDDCERRMQGQQLTDGGDNFAKLCSETSLVRAICAQLGPSSLDVSREREVSAELARRSGRQPRGLFVPLNTLAPQLEKRVLTSTGTGSPLAGGGAASLVGTDLLAGELVDVLRPSTVLGRLGSRILSGLVGNVSIPKMDSLEPSVQWLEEESVSALTPGEHSFTSLTAEPRTCGLMTTWSRKVLLQATPAIEQLIRSDFVQKLAVGVDRAGLMGDGSGGSPKGILANNISEETLSGNAVTWENVLSMIAKVQGADIPGSRLGFTFNSFVQKKLRSTTKVESDAAAGFIQPEPGALAGYPTAVTSTMAGTPDASPDDTGVMLFGDFAQLLLLFWTQTADILVNPFGETDFARGNVSVRAFVDMDCILRYDEAFCKAEGIAVA